MNRAGPNDDKSNDPPLNKHSSAYNKQTGQIQGCETEEMRAQMAVTVIWAHWYVFLGFVSFVFIN
jgi:hypothetical protein